MSAYRAFAAWNFKFPKLPSSPGTGHSLKKGPTLHEKRKRKKGRKKKKKKEKQNTPVNLNVAAINSSSGFASQLDHAFVASLKSFDEA